MINDASIYLLLDEMYTSFGKKKLIYSPTVNMLLIFYVTKQLFNS